jgi:mRNA interferase MazF
MICSRNDIALLPIPFSDLSSQKVRPAVVVGKNKNDLLVVPITSQLFNTDMVLSDWRSEGLNVSCGIKGQICTIEERLVRKVVGRLSANDQNGLDEKLRVWLDL